MLLSEIQSKIYSLTGTDSVSYPNANMVIDMNIWQNKVVSIINLAQDESDYDDPNWGDYPMNTTALTTKRDYYINPTEKVISIKNVNLSYDGVTWYRAEPLDDSEMMDVAFPPASYTAANSTLDSKFTKTNPRYDVKYNAVFVYPKPSAEDVSAGGLIKIEWSREPDLITVAQLVTGTKIPGFDTTFHPILAYGPAYEYLYAKKQYAASDRAKVELDIFNSLLEKQYGSKQKDRLLAVGANDEINQGFQ